MRDGNKINDANIKVGKVVYLLRAIIHMTLGIVATITFNFSNLLLHYQSSRLFHVAPPQSLRLLPAQFLLAGGKIDFRIIHVAMENAFPPLVSPAELKY